MSDNEGKKKEGEKVMKVTFFLKYLFDLPSLINYLGIR